MRSAPLVAAVLLVAAVARADVIVIDPGSGSGRATRARHVPGSGDPAIRRARVVDDRRPRFLEQNGLR